MRIRHVTAPALLLLALTGCGAPAVRTSPAPAAATATSGTAARCTAADLSASLGERTGGDQVTVALVFTNTSAQPCDLYGVPGVDLKGPDDPTFGPTYSLPRPGAGDVPKHVLLAPGAAASAPLTYVQNNGGTPGWVPTTIVTTPPGDTGQLTVPWGSGDSVLRQDAATHPGTYVHAVQPA